MACLQIQSGSTLFLNIVTSCSKYEDQAEPLTGEEKIISLWFSDLTLMWMFFDAYNHPNIVSDKVNFITAILYPPQQDQLSQSTAPSPLHGCRSSSFLAFFPSVPPLFPSSLLSLRWNADRSISRLKERLTWFSLTLFISCSSSPDCKSLTVLSFPACTSGLRCSPQLHNRTGSSQPTRFISTHPYSQHLPPFSRLWAPDPPAQFPALSQVQFLSSSHVALPVVFLP